MKLWIKRIIKNDCIASLLAWGVSLYLKCVRITSRWQVIVEGDMPDDSRFIFACWHGRILMSHLAWHHTGHGKTPLHFIVSPSSDGIILRKFLQNFGFCPLVGSSGSGTGFLPFKKAIKILKQGTPFGIAPDGSRGPVYRMKDGLGFLAVKQQVPVVLYAFNTSRRRVLNSWDKMVVPKLFSRGIIIIKVIDVPTMKQLDKPALNVLLEQALCDVTQRADMYFEHA